MFNGCGRPISGVVKMGRFARGEARAGRCSEQPHSPSRNEGEDLVGSLLESRRYGMAIGGARSRAGTRALKRPRTPTLNPTLTLIAYRALALARWGHPLVLRSEIGRGSRGCWWCAREVTVRQKKRPDQTCDSGYVQVFCYRCGGCGGACGCAPKDIYRS